MIRSNSTKNATSYKKYTPYNLLKNKVAVKVAEKIKQMKKATKRSTETNPPSSRLRGDMLILR